MDECDATIRRDVRVGIGFRGFAVGRPAGVADGGGGRGGRVFRECVPQFRELSGSLDDGGDAAVGAVEGDAGGVVTPVFQSGEAG